MNNLLDILEKTNKIYVFGAASRAKTIKGYMNMLFPRLEIKVAMDSRKDLGRPAETAKENKKEFMKYIAGNEGTGI